MIGPERLPVVFRSAFQKGRRFLMFTLLTKAGCELYLALNRLRMIRAVYLPTELDGTPKVQFGECIFTEKAIGHSQILPRDCLGAWPALKAVADFPGCCIECAANGRVDSQAAGPALRSCRLQHILDEKLAECLRIRLGFHGRVFGRHGFVAFVLGNALLRPARTRPTLVPTMPPMRAKRTRLTASTGLLFRRRNLRRR